MRRSTVSRINLVSAIIEITAGEDKFLFTADAGIASFENIPDYEQRLKDLFWLKVPHHASRNNFTGTLCELMSPKVAAISGAARIEPAIVACLQKRSCRVERTMSTLTYEELAYNR
jgi:beta-lactamase superfamily II metal-dependent hydrolase